MLLRIETGFLVVMNVLLVALGGACGAVSRHAVNVFVLQQFGAGFPLATLTVNVVGSFLMGVVTGLVALGWNISPRAQLFLMTGLLGGFTTFSAFSIDVLALHERGEWVSGLIYVITSVVLSITAAFLGIVLVRRVLFG